MVDALSADNLSAIMDMSRLLFLLMNGRSQFTRIRFSVQKSRNDQISALCLIAVVPPGGHRSSSVNGLRINFPNVCTNNRWLSGVSHSSNLSRSHPSSIQG